MSKTLSGRLASMLVCLAMILSLAGCAPAQSAKDKEGTIKLTDQAGREVTLEQPARRLVSCYYITTYAALALGISDRIVGLEKKAGTRPVYEMADKNLLSLTQVGSLKELNIEAVAELKPDLVLMPVKLKDKAQTLTELGIKVLVVNPESQEKLLEMMALIGKACGVEERAKELAGYYQTQIQKMSETQDQNPKTVYMGGNSSYMETAPGAMYQSALIETAGGVNAAGKLKGDYWIKVSYESILEMDPDMIVVPPGASYTAQDIMDDAQLQSLGAVQGQAVYQMPRGIEEWDSPIPAGILGTMWLHSVLYSDVYPYDSFVRDAREFYRTFYGFELDEHLLEL